MLDILAAVGFAIFVWWFSTGVVLMLDGLPRRSFRWSLVASTVLMLLGLAGIAALSSVPTVAAAYGSFGCALLVWGWHELSFLTGWITGPRKVASPEGVRGWMRFRQAVGAILWHELAIVTTGVALVLMTWQQPNAVGTWTFVVLWAMRTSAKLNLFLGVRNLSEEFLPPHLAYLQSFFRRRRMNALFPVSVTVSTWALALLVWAAMAPGTPAAQATGLWLVAALLAMGLLEHWFLVLPISASGLWRWAMRKPPVAALSPLSALSPPSPPQSPSPTLPLVAEAPHPEEVLLHAR